MEHYRRTAHTRFGILFHLVWITKHRKKLPQAEKVKGEGEGRR
jgi:REP element-mobilizing transposase RayT